MKTAAEIYKDELKDAEIYLCIADYTPMLEAFGEIVIQVDDADYQGDSRVLYKDGDKWGYLQFGWGSCSGCDALQACEGAGDIQKLMDELHNDIIWFENKTDCLHWFKTRDWKGQYCWHEEETKEFVTKVIDELS